MKDLRHPNVMTLIGVCLDAGPGVSIACNALHGKWKPTGVLEERQGQDLSP